MSEWGRVDIPPHDIVRQPGKDERKAWNSDYLGEHIETEPSVSFESLPVTKDAIRIPELQQGSNHTYFVEILETEEELAEVVALELLPNELPAEVPEQCRERFDGLRDRYRKIDFDDTVLVFVASGRGSSSIEQRWARVEAANDGLHLHGYYSQPEIVTSDGTFWASLLAIDRTGIENQGARVSLTVDECNRVHFESTEGFVTLIPALVGNDWVKTATLEVRIISADGHERVSDSVSVGSDLQWWRTLGLFGEYGESYTVEARVEGFGMETTETYHADAPLGIWLTEDGKLTIESTAGRR
ncbi:hypothetical protein [Natronobacterium texcoconense]|uniref:hypothetical protein n=1 Tax=Natronobacterium texcoconense TaxID=1095778 RepID=UPI0011136C16|nr:hypothetical protein [Natronobacterium texcoconense]